MPRCAARLVDGVGDDHEHRLPDALHEAGREDRIVVEHRAEVVLARNVVGGDHVHHAGGGAHGREVHRHDPGMGPLREPEGRMDRAARLADVVDVGRLAGDVQVRRLVADRLADAACRARQRRLQLGCVHGRLSMAVRRVAARPSPPAVSRWSFFSRFRATCRR